MDRPGPAAADGRGVAAIGARFTLDRNCDELLAVYREFLPDRAAA